LREQVGALLTERISGELQLLKQRLEQLKSQGHDKARTNANWKILNHESAGRILPCCQNIRILVTGPRSGQAAVSSRAGLSRG
jgi:hypothetical protein